MRVKRIICLLLSMVIIGTLTPAIADNQRTATPENTDIYAVISTGIGCAEAYLREQVDSLHANGGVSYGCEWYIISLLRGGKNLEAGMLDEYYTSAVENIKSWNDEVKPTDVEKTALALIAMGKDITDIEGINLLDIICNSEKLSSGANELAYALISVYASGEKISEGAKWNETDMITELLKFQATDGGFGLYNSDSSDVDITAICLQALAPYRNEEIVNRSIDRAVAFLTAGISEEWDYADNPNSTAQVLIALAMLEIDVTDSENGFGKDEQNNIITALEKYRNAGGNGYVYASAVNPMATVQVLQAYDAYRKAQKEKIMYWDFGAEGQIYADIAANDDEVETEPEEKEAEPCTVYITIADEGKIVTDKNGRDVGQAIVTVYDNDKNGVLTVDEALYAAHEIYYNGGAENGYRSHTATYGLSLARLWGKGSEEAPAAAGYYLNNASCWSLSDTIKEGDYITAFNYCDTDYWSDAYSYFAENTVETKQGDSVALTLSMLGYDSDWNSVTLPCEGAKVVFLGNNYSTSKILTTDKDGAVKISFADSASVGSYYVMAYKEDGTIVPAVCKINVSKRTGAGTGGGSASDIAVYISVADPKGRTYLRRTAYRVKKGMTVYELLQKTGLNVEAEEGMQGTYVKAIEGLAEFDEGTGSGWMYRVNGKFYTYSASEHSLSYGDYVEWLYTRNHGKDVDDSYYIGGSSGNKKTEGDKNVNTEKTPEVQKNVFAEDTYKDVNTDDWYYEAVKYAYENSLMQGTGKGFEPAQKMSRAMLVTVLYRMAKPENPDYSYNFADVPEGIWYSDAVAWAGENGIVNGIGGNKFNPDGDISREQIALIIYRFAKMNGLDMGDGADISHFSDKNVISDWAMDAIEWAYKVGLINGTGTTVLSPGATATRAQVAAILMRFCQM